jgi:hypothetical protein
MANNFVLMKEKKRERQGAKCIIDETCPTKHTFASDLIFYGIFTGINICFFTFRLAFYLK